MSGFSEGHFEKLTGAYNNLSQAVDLIESQRRLVGNRIQNNTITNKIKESKLLPQIVKKGADFIIGCYAKRIDDILFDERERRFKGLRTRISRRIVEMLEEREGEYPVLLGPLYMEGRDIEKPLVCELGYEVGSHMFRFRREFDQLVVVNGGSDTSQTITIPKDGIPVVRANILQVVDTSLIRIGDKEVRMGSLALIANIHRASAVVVDKNGETMSYYLN